MNYLMTGTAKWDDIKWLRIIWMMIISCVRSTIKAFELFSRFYSTCHNCISNHIFRFNSFRITFFIDRTITPMGNFGLFALFVFYCSMFTSNFTFFGFTISLLTFFVYVTLLILSMVFLEFFTLSIQGTTRLTLILQSIILRFIFMEFCQWFNLFAVRTSFCYNLFRHIRSFQRVCLEPFTRPILVCGSFYYTIQNNFVKR